MARLPDHDSEQMFGGPARRRTVAIVPGAALARYGELWRALEEAYPVAFVGRCVGDVERADGAIVFPGEPQPERLRIPCLILQAPGEARPRSAFTVEISRSDGVDRALRGQRLGEDSGECPAAVPVPDGWRILAASEGRPIWATFRGAGVNREVASAVPSDLADHEFLRDHLTAGRFWSLLPVAHFLKRISGGISEHSRPLGACFIIDDPNLRLPSYGHLKFAELARDARECGYHVAVATIPLDLVIPGHRAVGVFRKYRSELSLVMHGNNHLHRELERPRNARDADRLIRSATTRVAAFERRAGIRVDRVMCPPHGACGAPTLAALFRFGFLGLAASRAFPWDDFADHQLWRSAGWFPAQLTGGGLPVVSRYSLTRNLDDLVFRAFLEQPLILYCHHTDIRDGLQPFRVAAARTAELGDVRWMSLASITSRNALCSERDGVATVELYSRDLRIPRPQASTVRIEVPRVFGGDDFLRLIVDGTSHEVGREDTGLFHLTVASRPQTGDLHIRIPEPVGPGGATFGEWLPRAWPVTRRLLTETRDRVRPLLRKAHR